MDWQGKKIMIVSHSRRQWKSWWPVVDTPQGLKWMDKRSLVGVRGWRLSDVVVRRHWRKIAIHNLHRWYHMNDKAWQWWFTGRPIWCPEPITTRERDSFLCQFWDSPLGKLFTIMKDEALTLIHASCSERLYKELDSFTLACGNYWITTVTTF
jgi:hypothetical protein